ELALVMGLGAGKASRNDLAIFLDEITQRVEIFVVDLFNAGGCEAAELATLGQRILLGELAFFLAFLEVSHSVPLCSRIQPSGVFSCALREFTYAPLFLELSATQAQCW